MGGLCSLDAQRVKHIVRGPNQGVRPKARGRPSALDTGQDRVSFEMDHLILHRDRRIFDEHDEREVIRGIVGEINQFWELQGCERAEQQTNHDRNDQFKTHEYAQELLGRLYTTKEIARANARIFPGAWLAERDSERSLQAELRHCLPAF
jgi:hypothetical protein